MRERIKKVLKKFTWIDWLLVGAMVAGLVYLLIFSFNLLNQPKQTVEYLAGDVVVEIWVDVSGAVVNPGVYQLTSGARIKDALVAAGGLTDGADREFVSRNLNLAKKVADGDKIYIPTTASADDRVRGVAAGVNINKAGLGELETLSGIGQVRAKAIIDNRPYATVDDLVTKKVLSLSLLDKIRTEITVY